MSETGKETKSVSCMATKGRQLFSLGFEKLEFLDGKLLEGQDYSACVFVASVPASVSSA